MKKAIILIFLCGSFAAWSQSIGVGSIDIIPKDPNVNDSVKVAIMVFGTDYGPKIYDSLSIFQATP